MAFMTLPLGVITISGRPTPVITDRLDSSAPSLTPVSCTTVSCGTVTDSKTVWDVAPLFAPSAAPNGGRTSDKLSNNSDGFWRQRSHCARCRRISHAPIT
jgi:hypothetical protein